MAETINRRDVLSVLGSAGIVGLAGCSEGGTEEPAGERVPTLEYHYFTGFISTDFSESVAPLHEEYWQELGIETNITPVDVGEGVTELWDDKRVCHIFQWGLGSGPQRLEPFEMLQRLQIQWAGTGGDPNTPNYTDCRTTELFYEQAAAASDDERREMIYGMAQRFSEAVGVIPQAPHVIYGAWRTDVVDTSSGDLGSQTNNVEQLLDADVDGDQLITNIDPYMIESMNHLNSATGGTWWYNFIDSPLVTYDRQNNFKPILAESLEMQDSGASCHVVLEGDAQFNNGDPVTTEEVRWSLETFDTIRDDLSGTPQTSIGEFEIIDDQEMIIHLENPNVAYISGDLPRGPILHPDTWDGIRDDPIGFVPDPDSYVGSGPMELELFTGREVKGTTPVDYEHVAYNPDYGIVFQAVEDTSTGIESLLAGELHLLRNLSRGNIDRIEGSNQADNIETDVIEGFLSYPLYPQHNWGPTKFLEFRKALGQAINHDEVVELGYAGDSSPDPFASLFQPTHPFRPPDDRLYRLLDDTSGEPEKARSRLEENGWEWDGNDNIHFPEDADLDPIWPEGEGPTSEESNGGFSCLDENGDYVGS